MKTSLNVHPQLQDRDSSPRPLGRNETQVRCVYSSGSEVQLDENVKSFRQLHRNDIRSLSGDITLLDLIINTNAIKKG